MLLLKLNKTLKIQLSQKQENVRCVIVIVISNAPKYTSLNVLDI